MNLTVPDVIDDFRAYVAKPENSVGGSLHIVLDDLNCDDADVEWCERFALEQGDEEGARLARVLRSMSYTQRMKIARRSLYGRG